METEIIGIANKLTVNGMGLIASELKALVKPGGKPIPIAGILALVDGMSEKPSRFDETQKDTRFSGYFEGVNKLTGETFRASSMFLPKAAAQWLRGLVVASQATAKKDGKEKAQLPAIAFDLTVQHDAAPNSSQGYKYGTMVTVEKSSADPFAELRKSLPKPKGAGK